MEAPGTGTRQAAELEDAPDAEEGKGSWPEAELEESSGAEVADESGTRPLEPLATGRQERELEDSSGTGGSSGVKSPNLLAAALASRRSLDFVLGMKTNPKTNKQT